MHALARGRLAAVGLIFWAPYIVLAQNTTKSGNAEVPADGARLDRVEQRMAEIERRHAADLAERDKEIARLRSMLEQRSPAVESPKAAKPAAGGTKDLLNEIDSAGSGGGSASPAERVARDAAARDSLTLQRRSPVSFNPDLAVVGMFQGNVSTDNANPARNRFDIGSVELDLRAAVDPRADAVVVLPVVREVADPLFHQGGADEAGVETAIEIEEAYLFLHDFGVPNLTAKLGRFHLRFGRQNVLHAHDWPTIDNNFAAQSFLGREALSDAGLSLSYVIPPKLTGGNYLELIAEIISGEGGGDEAPVFNNSALVDSPGLNVHALWNRDFGPWNVEIGASWLTGKRNDDNRQNANLFGIDLTMLYTDPSGGFQNTLIQAEAMYGVTDVSRERTENALGAYALVQQQINRDWYAGVRLDWTQNATDSRQEVWGVSPYVSWYWSEFLRFRVEYQHKGGDTREVDTLFFQVVFIFGAHPPHPYWSMR